jgi:hypothetical protein
MLGSLTNLNLKEKEELPLISLSGNSKPRNTFSLLLMLLVTEISSKI